jgi:hypothetical protein
MDSQQTAILSIVSISLSVFGTVFGLLNGHRISSSCCGRKSSLSVEDVTPKNSQPLIDDAHPLDKVAIP